MPRSNTSPSEATTRPRSRGPARSAMQRPASADAAAEMSSSTPGNGGDMQYNPSYDEIAEAAYQRYLRRGGTDGQDFDDWLEAERELKSRRSS